jgi:hypothetical protein
MKFGHEVERIAKTPLAVETQLHTALLPYKRLKKQIRHNGCVEPHVDALSDPDMSAPNLPIPGEGGGAAPDVRSSSGGDGGAAAAGGGQLPRTSSAPEVAHLMENSPFLRFLEGELRTVTKKIEDEAERIEQRAGSKAADSQEVAKSAEALHMVFTTNQTALRKILKKLDVRAPGLPLSSALSLHAATTL